MHAARRNGQRRGFTLIEMILALAIGVLLLGALYLTMNSQIEVSDHGREVVEHTALVRALFQRITSDTQTCLQAIDPRILPESAVVTSSSTETGTTGTSETDSESTDNSMTPMEAVTLYNLGVEGDSSRLTISVARVPREILGRDKIKAAPGQLPTVSDLRRITYWLVPPGEGGTGGLARQEVTGVTGADADSIPPNVPNPGAYVIASEVTNLLFEYKGISEAPDASWSSTEQDVETGLLRGPPAAIIVRMTVRAKDGSERTHRHVIALPTGNNYPPQ